MKKILKSKLAAGILILVVVCLGIVLAGDVIVKEGTLDAENINATGTIEGGSITTAGTIEGGSITTAGKIEGGIFKSTGCTASGTKAVAFGYETEASGGTATAMGYLTTASGNYSTAMGYNTTASGNYSTAMGNATSASGSCSTAMGFMAIADGDMSTAIGFTVAAGPANYSTAIGKGFFNNVQDSFAVGFGQMDFRVESGKVTVGDRDANEGILVVGNYVDANDYLTHSSFYDKDTYGSALVYSEDISKTIKLNAEGQKEYDHEADPDFLQRWVTVKDYDKYTEEEVWNDLLEQTITSRIYETHQELRSNLSMKVAWLRQCVFELKQENQTLKDEIAQIKDAVGIE